MRRLLPLLCAFTALAAASGPVDAQWTPGDAGVLGVGEGATATVRGPAALGVNPAGLALDRRFRVVLLPVTLGTGLDPVTVGDLRDASDRRLTDDEKAAWIDRIARAGGETGTFDAGLAGVSASWRGFALQVSVAASGDLRLNPDAAELVLYGNAGRTGEPRAFELDGSRIDGWATTTFAAGHGLRIGTRLDLGVTAKLVVGNALVIARDGGSRVGSDPIEFAAEFPTVVTAENAGPFDGGVGFGVDLGARWTEGDWVFAAVLRDPVHTFAWNESSLRYRPASALFDGTESTSDVDERPLGAAPLDLLTAVRAATFDPSLAAGAAWTGVRGLRLSADVRRRFGDGVGVGPDWYAGVAAESERWAPVPLRAHLGAVPGGIQVGGGATLRAGPVAVSAAGAIRTGSGAATRVVALSLGWDGR